MSTTDTFPTTIDESAPVVVRREVRIEAPIDLVWRLHTDVAAWPTWQTDVASAHIDGPLVPGASFRWSTHGIDVTSTVYALDAPRRILWGGPAQGVTGIHEWTFAAEGGATIVRTAESWDGDPVRADAEGQRAALDASLGAWLTLLRTKAEAKATKRAKRAPRRRWAKVLAWMSLGLTALFVLAEPWLLVPVLTFALALSLWD
ncbi:SRPBCC family protein [Xylanimonas ulmi]|uniref:Polyketide cyclase/dehydrase/lipid transport protein n=1 Tax=Xylanimonas ulmi TaxID=228973 RepID=A0A4Q7M3R9_9MICO|nr:SRPBCC family protein [Xylanibacterium ulmi]RZS62576.1 polyketide cyclase/dehydrase/lipid transport protein [Xylanibacterium ulmi]